MVKGNFKQALVTFQALAKVDDIICASLFDVSSASVTRWRLGETVPRAPIQKHVYSVIASLISDT